MIPAEIRDIDVLNNHVLPLTQSQDIDNYVSIFLDSKNGHFFIPFEDFLVQQWKGLDDDMRPFWPQIVHAFVLEVRDLPLASESEESGYNFSALRLVKSTNAAMAKQKTQVVNFNEYFNITLNAVCEQVELHKCGLGKIDALSSQYQSMLDSVKGMADQLSQDGAFAQSMCLHNLYTSLATDSSFFGDLSARFACRDFTDTESNDKFMNQEMQTFINSQNKIIADFSTDPSIQGCLSEPRTSVVQIVEFCVDCLRALVSKVSGREDLARPYHVSKKTESQEYVKSLQTSGISTLWNAAELKDDTITPAEGKRRSAYLR